MNLGERLQRLRGHSGAGVEATGTDLSTSLADRIGRLSARRAPTPGGTSADPAALAWALGAQELAPGVLRLERLLAGRVRHGCVTLGPGLAAAASGTLPLLPGVQTDPATQAHGTADAPAGWLCLDTETSGLAGGTGTWAFVTGLLRSAGDGWLLRQYLLTRLDAEPAYLERVGAELAGTDLLISYNGRSFDVPLLSTRFRLAGQPDPFVGRRHLDLLAPVRRAFARPWPDCRLATAEARLLEFIRRGDLPGAAAPGAWLRWLRAGEMDPLAGVLRHNRWDLLSLAGLAPLLERVYRDPAAFNADCRSVAAAHLAAGDPGRALAILVGNRRQLEPAGLLDLARLYRRRGDWPRAVGIWEALDAAGDAEARTALASFHEHRSGNLTLALSTAERLPSGPDRERRCGRLRRRLASCGGSNANSPTPAITKSRADGARGARSRG